MPANSGGVLVCTLGTTWAVVPEVLALVAPDVLDLYGHHPKRAEICAEVERRRLVRPNEVWVATTRGTEDSVAKLAECWALLSDPPPLRIWKVAAGDLTTPEECATIRELIFRLVAYATEKVGPERTVLSLAGGRKTMSADMQWAGTWFGCAACVHVLDAGGRLPEELRNPTPERFAGPLSGELAAHLFPVFLGPFAPSDLLYASAQAWPRISAADFPLDGRAERSGKTWQVVDWEPGKSSLVECLLEREQRKAEVYAGHIQRLLAEEDRPNWYGLYRLPLLQIETLRKTPLGPQHRDWLRALPKAELHCHLGGVLDLPAQREVARALWDSLTRAERERAKQAVPWLHELPWPEDWWQRLRRLANRSEATAAILVQMSEEELEARLFAPTEPRLALRNASERGGFHAYELPGELSGSALLQREAAIEEYARQTLRRLARDGVVYCELRASPQKYLRGEGPRFVRLFAEAVRKAESGLSQRPRLRLLFVLDRRHGHGASEPSDTIRRLAEVGQDFKGFAVGFDVAGDEASAPNFDVLCRALEPAFAACLPVTIHAGEGEPPENIWQAVYRLHAERVGHGLTLDARPDLARRLRDRGIAIELCPTSNVEVVGFYDPDEPHTEGYPEYPLRSYFRSLQLDVVICTDNPGISRTDLASEYLRAARMAGGLSLWETLSLVRAAFEHAFTSAEERAELLRQADVEVVRNVAALLGSGG